MSDDNYDDGLVHGHAWSDAETAESRNTRFPLADAASVRVVSTTLHDDYLFCE